MVLWWGTMGPTRHLGLRDVTYALRYPWIQHVWTRWLQLGHFQVPLEAPKYSSNPRPIRPEIQCCHVCSSVRLCLMVFTPHSFSSAFDCIRCFCKHIAVSVNTRYHGRISTFIIIRKHSQNSNYFNGKANGNHVPLFKCACETDRLPVFKQSRKLPYVVFGMHFRSILFLRLRTIKVW